jgi:cyanate permease
VLGPAVAGAVRDATDGWTATWGALAAIAVGAAIAAALVRLPRAG